MEHSKPSRLLRYWGKTGTASDNGETTETYHPVVYHCLDVAACGRRLLVQNPLLRERLASASGLTAEGLLGWVTFLLTLHDLGKLADGFQALAPEWMQRLQGRLDNPGYPYRHDSLGYWLWSPDLPLCGDAEILGALLPEHGQMDSEELWYLLETWLHPTAGHHGRPPCPQPTHFTGRALLRQFPEAVIADARQFVLWSVRRFLPEGGLVSGFSPPVSPEEDPFDDRLRRLEISSWLFAGLAVTADWIGSNTDWFPHEMEAMPLEEYWERASHQAEVAVAASGLTGHRAAASGFDTLFPDYTPTPLQRLAQELALVPGPQIVVLEESTGGGKTEAALVLAQRLMAEGHAQGIFLGLPTMATANAMYDRVGEIHELLFEPGRTAGAEPPSLILAHSKRHLRLPLQKTSTDGPYTDGSRSDGEEELTASMACTAWLADGRKRALLADVGVGTIDQGLLGVLPVRHQSVRLWGLAGKVLLVDEVHACDSYVQTLLQNLLEFHAAFGGSAILLSATLPKKQRQALVSAFFRGLDTEAPRLESTAYPLLTHAGIGHFVEEAVETRDEVRRQVAVEFLDSEEAVEATLLSTLEKGQCACWIRNTVNDAREAFVRLRPVLGDRVQLFHSRFTVGDRNRIETDVLRHFGKRSGPEERSGRLLIATQVVEQSLDLDFDVLVTDLCPMDLILQRAGRLRRHGRTADGARTDGPDERGPVVLHVLAPPLETEPPANWYRQLFSRGAYVYQDHGRLWLTARKLADLGGFRIPDQAREVIEAVYGPEAETTTPEPLQRSSDVARGESQAARALASFTEVRLTNGYKATSIDWPEDAYTPTRLGEPTVVLRLARREGERIVPFARSGRHRWEMSEVSIRRRQVAEEDPAELKALEAVHEEMGPAGRWTRVVILTPDGEGWRGRAVDEQGRTVHCIYDSVSGLETELSE